MYGAPKPPCPSPRYSQTSGPPSDAARSSLPSPSKSATTGADRAAAAWNDDTARKPPAPSPLRKTTEDAAPETCALTASRIPSPSKSPTATLPVEGGPEDEGAAGVVRDAYLAVRPEEEIRPAVPVEVPRAEGRRPRGPDAERDPKNGGAGLGSGAPRGTQQDRGEKCRGSERPAASRCRHLFWKCPRASATNGETGSRRPPAPSPRGSGRPSRASRRRGRRPSRMSRRRSATDLPADVTSKQPQSMAFPRKRLREIAATKTRRSAPTSAADVRVQIPRMSASPTRSSNHGITRAMTFTSEAGDEPVVVDHVREGRRVADLRERRGDEEDAERDLDADREPG